MDMQGVVDAMTNAPMKCAKCHSRDKYAKECSACKIVSYCGKECQKADWKRHKTLCLDCRLFIEHSPQILEPPLKVAIDEYSMLKLPPIDEEYNRAFRGEDATLNKLHIMYIGNSLKITRNMLRTSLHQMEGDDPTAHDFWKRWQGASPDLLTDFVIGAKPGDIFLKKQYTPYDPGAPQQFRNTPMAEPGKLENGKTFVDIGFVDFGMTFDSIDSLRFDDAPLVVVGYEAEAQCVAKSMIMITMMKDSTVSARSVVEVWLSSLWSNTTLQAFNRAARRLVERADTIRIEVRAIIQFWSEAPNIPKEEMLEMQLKAAVSQPGTKVCMNCCSLESESDRVTYLRYHFTKALYEDDTTAFGSIVMGLVNDELGVKQLYACGMEAVPTYIHYSYRDDVYRGTSFMARTINYFEERMTTYMSHIRKGSLVFTPKLGIVSLENKELIQELRALDPYLVHWSNVVDYLKPADFHAIAKEISGEDTIHSLHSCNWVSRVFGADIHEINYGVRLRHYSHGLYLMKKCHTNIKGICDYAPMHYRNICSSALGLKYVDKFFQYFFEEQEVNCASAKGNTPLKIPHPLSRSNDTAFVTFAYKESGITFGKNNYNFHDK